MNVPIEAVLLYVAALDLAYLAGLLLSARELGFVVVDEVRVEVKVISISSRRANG